MNVAYNVLQVWKMLNKIHEMDQMLWCLICRGICAHVQTMRALLKMVVCVYTECFIKYAMWILQLGVSIKIKRERSECSLFKWVT